MGDAYFYHLTDSPLDQTLPMLLGKATGAGWRILVRGTDPEILERLDKLLWERDPDSFLPHGLAGGPHDDDQPILLGTDVPSDAFDCVISVTGAGVAASEVAQSKRTCVIFDGLDQAAVEFARNQWKALTDAEIPAKYWAQENGSWVEKASNG